MRLWGSTTAGAIMRFVHIQGEYINIDLLARIARRERNLTLYLSGIGSHGYKFQSDAEAQATEEEILRAATAERTCCR